MPQRELLSPAQRVQFTEIPPDMSERDMARYYTLTEDDLKVINRHRGAHNRLGFAVQLCYCRFPGRTLNPGEEVPGRVLDYVAAQLKVSPDVMQEYARDRDPTRREHQLELQKAIGFRPFTAREYRDLSTWLLPMAMGTDKATALVAALVGELRARKILMPGITTLERLGWEVRRRAQRSVFRKLIDGLTPTQLKQLDGLLTLPRDSRMSHLVWLRQPPGQATTSNFLKIVERLEFIRSIGIDPGTGRRVHQNRLLQLGREGAKYTPQHLERFDEQKRYATLVAFMLEASEDLVDQGIDMHDKLIGQLFSKGERRHTTQFTKSGKAINEKVRHFNTIGEALIDARNAQADPYTAIELVMPWDKFVKSVEEAGQLARPADFDYLDLLDSRYGQLRKYTPKLIENFEFKAAAPCVPLLKALHLIKELNEAGRRRVPDDAPVTFVKPRWEKHVFKDGGIDRHYYEMCVFSELRSTLRSGDMWVVGSRQYKDFEDYLLPQNAWQQLRQTGEIPVAVDLDFETYIAQRRKELHEQLSTVSQLMAENKLPDVKLVNNQLHITPLQKAVPEGVDDLMRRAYGLLPRIKLTDLLVEVDGWTQFTRHFTHLHSGDEVKDRLVLLAAILADGINMGLSKMADACPGVTFERLSWVADWYIRDETFSKGLAEIVNFHHRVPFSAHWGDGTTSSSDGQGFKAGGRPAATDAVNAKYGPDPTVLFYTHVSDQYSPFHVKVISSTVRDATYVLDGLLYHETDLNIQEHYTDTAGYTDHVFAMCHLLGFRFAPRIRDLGDKRLYSIEKATEYPGLAPLLGGTVNVKQIEQHWDEILRLTSSIRQGTVTASLMMRKLASYPRQNGLAWALREIGRIEKTLFTLQWLQSPELRRRVHVGLNKGESRNALARAVFFNRLGEVRDRSYEDQRHRASALNLVVAAIILWNTVYLARAVEELRNQGMAIPEELLEHLSPLGWEHVVLTGDYVWDLRQGTTLDRLRPLRKKPSL